jgi:hypothetical protein
MSGVRVTFTYDPDDNDPTGVTEEEFLEKTDILMQVFALSDAAEFERVD